MLNIQRERGRSSRESFDVHARHRGTMLGDYVIVYLVLCLVSLAIGLITQGWEHTELYGDTRCWLTQGQAYQKAVSRLSFLACMP